MTKPATSGPDEEDQAICKRFILYGGAEGSAMCFLFGAYRHAGWSRDEAVAKVCEAMMAQGERP